jgi:hypothetical protein
MEKSMLNKNLCKKCWGNYWKELCHYTEDEISLEEYWENGKIICNYSPTEKDDGWDIYGKGLITNHPPLNCPYRLEHILNE